MRSLALVAIGAVLSMQAFAFDLSSGIPVCRATSTPDDVASSCAQSLDALAMWSMAHPDARLEVVGTPKWSFTSTEYSRAFAKASAEKVKAEIMKRGATISTIGALGDEGLGGGWVFLRLRGAQQPAAISEYRFSRIELITPASLITLLDSAVPPPAPVVPEVSWEPVAEAASTVAPEKQDATP